MSDPKIATFFVVLFIFTPLFIPDIAVSLSKNSLKLLKIGGGYESVLYLDKKIAQNLPNYILDEKYNDLSRTKKVKILLNIGDNIYFKYQDKKQTFEIKKDTIIFAEIEK